MHLLESAHDGIDWAGFDTNGAANAARLIDHRHLEWPLGAVFWIEWNDRLSGDFGQQGNPLCATGRALIDRGLTASNRFRIRATGRIAATRTLGLR